MNWINFLHIYQPPTQSKEVFDRVAKESYTLIPKLLTDFPNLKLTVNVSGSLLELLEQNGYQKIIESLAHFVKKGQIELVGSAMYHPILPLVPGEVAREQISMQHEISRKHFGADFAPKGFYLPEMAYSAAVGRMIKELGYEWIILDENSAQGEKVSPDVRYEIESVGLGVIFRNNRVSKDFPLEYIYNHNEVLKDQYLVTAHDGELYGHWHKDDRGYYKKAFADSHIRFLTASEYLADLTNKKAEIKKVHVVESSWETTPEEHKNGIPFALWNDPNNVFHQKLWDLARFTMETVSKNKNDAYIGNASRRMHRGLASCAWWWATERKLGVFSPVCWNPAEIEKGGMELLEAIRTLKTISASTRKTAEKMFSALHEAVWENHWNKYNDKKE